MINAFEGLLSGSFPWLNHFQNMGVPLFEMGYYPVLYPPLFFSYLISMLFNNPYLLFEIFTVFHLFLAFIFTYFLARKLSKNEIISGIATLSYVFSGYIMIKLHDWYYVAPAIMFMPLLLLIHEKKSNKIKSFLFLGFIRGVFFYSGNIQFVTYSLFFEFIYVCIKYYSKSYSQKTMAQYFYSLIVSIIVALPNLVLLFLMSINSSRQFSIAGYFTSQFANPLAFFIGNIFPNVITTLVSTSQKFNYYYVNLILFFGFIFALFKYIKKYKLKTFRINPYLTLSVLSILLSFGVFGIIYNFFVIVPIWNKFIHPIKFLVFSSLFVSLVGAQYLSKRIKKKGTCVIFLVLTVIIIFTQIPAYSNTLNFERNEIPFNLDESKLDQGRVISLLQGDRYDFKYLTQNFASLSNTHHSSGYEHLMPKLNHYIVPLDRFGRSLFPNYEIDIERLSEYSVKWIITEGDAVESKNLKLKEESEKYKLYEISDSKPLLFQKGVGSSINHELTQNGVIFETDFDSDNEVILTNLFHPSYTAFIDGKKTDVKMDEFGRILLEIPKGNHKIKIEYLRNLFWLVSIFSSIVFFVLILFSPAFVKILHMILHPSIKALEKIVILLFKYWLISLIVLSIIYSGFIYLNLKNQGFIEAANDCKIDSSFISCVNKNHEKIKFNKMCTFLIENGIKYSFIGEVDTFCQDSQDLT